MMDFDTDAIRKRITKGYKDTIYKIKPIMDMTRHIDKNQVNPKSNMKNMIKRIFKK